MALNKQIIIDAIIKHIEKGKTFNATLAVICPKFQFTQRTFSKYWKLASAAYSDRQEAIKKEIEELDKAAAIEARKKDIMSAEERMEFLTQIIRAKIDVKQVGKVVLPMVVYEDGTKDIIGIGDKLKALGELNRMSGDYAATKSDLTTNGKSLNTSFHVEVIDRRENVENE